MPADLLLLGRPPERGRPNGQEEFTMKRFALPILSALLAGIAGLAHAQTVDSVATTQTNTTPVADTTTPPPTTTTTPTATTSPTPVVVGTVTVQPASTDTT